MSRSDDYHILQGRTAGFVTRLFAYAADLVVVAGILALGGWLAVLVDDMVARMGVESRVDIATIYVFSIPLVIGLYFVMFWALTGRTIGKWFMGLKVIGENGRPPSIGRSLLRLVGYALSTVAFWIGFAWVIVDDERQGWHDHIAKTWVVYDYERHKGGELYLDFIEQRSDVEKAP